jgi:oxidase EvaA
MKSTLNKIYFSEMIKYVRIQKAINRQVTLKKLKDQKFHFMKWYNQCLKTSKKTKVSEISLDKLKGWKKKKISGKNLIAHSSEDFFEVIGIRVSHTVNREVKNGWDQPMIKQIGLDGGILGLVINFQKKYPEILVEAKFEPGNINKIQVSPTLQATFANINKKHGESKPRFVDLFLKPELYNANIILDQYMSEDGGRLYLKRNRNILLEVLNKKNFLNLPSNFKWVSVPVIKYLIRHSDIINPHIRSILSGF